MKNKNNLQIELINFISLLIFFLVLINNIFIYDSSKISPESQKEVILKSVLADGSVVTRSFSSNSVSLDTEVVVTLNVFLNGSKNYYMIDEVIPADFEIDISSVGDGNSSEPHHIKWVKTSSVVTTSYTYTIISPLTLPSISRNYNLTGNYIIEGMTNVSNIEGSTILTVNDVLSCTYKGGFECQEGEYCSGEGIDVDHDGNLSDDKCCSTGCSSPAWPTCVECGLGLFNICDQHECRSILEGCYFSEFFAGYGSCFNCSSRRCEDLSSSDCLSSIPSRRCNLDCVLENNLCITPPDEDNDGVPDVTDCNDYNVSIGKCTGCAVCSVSSSGLNNGNCIPTQTCTQGNCPYPYGICGVSFSGQNCTSGQLGILTQTSNIGECRMDNYNNGVCFSSCNLTCSDNSGCLIDSDNDGIPNAQDYCFSPNSTNVNKYGFPIINGSDLLKDPLSTNLTYLGLTNISNFTIGKTGIAKIEYPNHLINLFRNVLGVCQSIDIDKSVIIEHSQVEILPDIQELNKSAVITLYGIDWINPYILRDGIKCNDCRILSYDNSNKILVFEVPHFSSYSIGRDKKSYLTGDVVYEAVEGCGDKICDPEEGCNVCVSDCGNCGSSTSSTGGGGGGGGGGITPPGIKLNLSGIFSKNQFSLDKDEFSFRLLKGEQKTKGAFVITNLKDKEASLKISSDKDWIILSETDIVLKGKQAKTIEFDINLEGKDEFIYIGTIGLQSISDRKDIYISAEIVSSSAIRVSTEKLENDSELSPGGNLAFKLTITKLSPVDFNSVEMTYIIKDKDELEILSEKENLVLNEEDISTSITKNLNLPEDMFAGKYFLYAKANYGVETSSGSFWFDVSSKGSNTLRFFLGFLVFLIVAIIVIGIISFIRHRKESTENLSNNNFGFKNY